MCQRRATDADGKMDTLARRVQNFINGTNLDQATKDRWTNWVTEKKQAFDENMDSGNYCRAWNEYATMGKKITDLTFRYREKLVTAYRNLVQTETRLMKATEALRTVAQRIKASSASAMSS